MTMQLDAVGGEVRPRNFRDRHRDSAKVKANCKRYAERHPERIRAQSNKQTMRRAARRKQDPAFLARVRKDKANYRKRLRDRGISSHSGQPFVFPLRHLPDGSQTETALIASNARQAWIYWLKIKAPGGWLDVYYAATGKPWRDHRLSDAGKYRLRYRIDPRFQASEVLRTQRRNIKRAKIIAERDDGTLTVALLAAMFAAATHCTYCECEMRSEDKTHDHVVSLHRGGTHSASNAAICCKACNTAKHTMSGDEYRAALASGVRPIRRR
jgi:5-methylcytosine-specific restriction endonuclease McrA